jgi:aquaporin Z
MRKLAAEAFGTFCLVFAGTGAVVVNDASGGVVTHVGVALTFGLVVLAMIHSLGDVSGCHLNPAVTLGFWAAGRFEGRMIAPYAAAQCVGAVTASLALRAMFPDHPTLGATLPSGTAAQSWAMEFVLTAVLMFVILAVSTGPKEAGVLAGVAVGSVIALEALFAGPVSGASMNPARSLAPALAAWRLEHLWVYMTAPVLGAAAGVLACGLIRGRGCCRPQHEAGV